MKKSIIFAVLIMACFVGFSQETSSVNSGRAYETRYSQPQPGVHQLTFEFHDYSISEVTHDGVTYSKIDFASSTTTQQKGWAELPYVSAAIQLPANKNVDMEVEIHSAPLLIALSNPMLPSRGVIYRNQDPNAIPYEIAPESINEDAYPADIATMEEPYIVRDVRGTSVRVFPFRYISEGQMLIYYSNITVILRENNQPATNPLLRENLTPVREAVGMYQSMFLNYEPSRTALATGEIGDMLVLTPATYESAVEPYIQWKKEMGYNVTKQVVSSGANVVNTIQTAYNNNPNLMYVQLVGDWADIKSNTISSDGVNCPIDPAMGCVSGNDNYPDIAIGRFSCTNATHVTTQVNKAINYEKNPNMDAGWRETFIGIGSAEGSGSGDDGEIDYTHIQRIYSERLANFTYQTHQQNYGNSASASTLAGHVNQGASTIAYCGHGDVTEFVTTGYNNNNVNAATNGDKLPFIVSVACVNGAFHNSSDCFAEAWLRKQNGGAVVTLMSTINQPWTPPQRGQDYFYDILIGGFDYSQYSGQDGLSTNEQRTHWGAIVVNAFNLALQESSTSSDLETFKTWTTFGDASLQLRTKRPDAITVSNEAMMVGIPFTTIVTQNGEPVADALVCISQNDVYYHAYTDANGSVTIPHDFNVGEVLLVVTAFNTTTIYQNINCMAGNVPYLTFVSRTPDMVVHGTPQYLSMTMSNVGSVATTTNTTVTISCDNPELTINDGTDYLAPMAANGGTATISNGFMVTPSNNIVTGDVFTINYTATCGSDTWTGSFTLTGIGSDCDAPTGLTTQAEGNSVTLTWDDNSTLENITITDDVESHTYGTINSPGTVGWSYIDGDGANTGSFQSLTFTNEGSPMAYIVFDDTQISGSAIVSAHSGEKYFACPYARGSGYYSAGVNDDWIVSPELNFTSEATFSFYARSYSSSYANEQFYVAYSMTGNAASDFSNINPNPVTTTTNWTEYTYTIPANAKYVAIHCVSNDQYIFCVDDISISGEAYDGRLYNIYRNGELIASGITGGTYTDDNLEDGSYCYTITTSCINDLESAPSNSSCITIGSPIVQGCDSPTNLSATTVSSQIILTWNAVPSAISYRIYRDNQAINTTPENYFVDNSAESGRMYAYTVQSICVGEESAQSIPAYGSVGISQYAASDVKVYPNPTNGKIFIEGRNIQKIEVIDMSGRVVRATENNSVTDRIEMDLSGFASGMYLFRIVENDNVMMLKVSKN
ncbi:MAG: choice-of-anchor J domain-containing protein [Bacteroidales bacterium]|nr:choice-of-anchor J domain-containing protein [Bacteroidales bacterium]